MHKKLALLFMILVLAIPQPAHAAPTDVMVNVAANGTWPLSGAPRVQLGGFANCLGHITGTDEDNTTATVTFQGASKSDGPWDTIATVTFPSPVDHYYGGPCPNFFQVTVTNFSAVSGTLNLDVEGRTH